jgi:hypothetical protein
VSILLTVGEESLVIQRQIQRRARRETGEREEEMTQLIVFHSGNPA